MYSGLFPAHDTIGTQSSENSYSLQKFKIKYFEISCTLFIRKFLVNIPSE